MPSIFEKIALKVISYYLDNYINPIQGSQIKLALITGKAELNNVSIKSTALSIHHLPFTVTSGIIQSIKLHFPWQSLKSKPCIIEIDGIHIIAHFTKDVKLKSEIEIKENVLKDLEEAGLGDEKVKSVLFQGTISQIISNIIIHVKNIHIRVEIDTPDPKIYYAIGLMCDQIECFTINENRTQTFIQPDANLRKRIVIQGFSIYADPEPEFIEAPTTEEKVEEYLNLRYDEKHDFILDSFSFSSDYIITKKQFQTYSNMANQIDQIYFKLNQKQMTVFGEYSSQYKLFQLRQKYSLLGRPNTLPIGEVETEKEKIIALNWWKFIHKCTIEKRYPNRINIQESILILKTRTEYYNIWKIQQSMSIQDFKKNSKYKELKAIERKLPLNAILFLRNYSNYRINKEKEDDSKIVVDKSDLEMLTNTSVFESSIDISLLINKIKVKIYELSNDAKPILNFAAFELESKFIKSFDKSFGFSLNCKSMKIYAKEKVIFQQDSIDRSSIEINFKSLPNTKEEHVDIIASAPFINVDLKFLYGLKTMLYDNGFNKCPSSSYFTFTRTFADVIAEEANKYTPYIIRKGQYSDVILQKKCDEFPFIKLKMKLLSPTVQIQGAKLSFKMKEINFESFPIHERFADKVESLYINYLLKCIDFTIGFGDYEILRPVTIDFNIGLIIFPVEWLDKFRIALNISSIDVVFNKETYREIVSGLTQLLKFSQEFEQNKGEKVLAQKTEKSKQNNRNIDIKDMEKLSANYATKVSILFKSISLELVTVGIFDIVNFETQIIVSSNGLGLNLRIENIICNSIENKYIFFDINKIESNDHFLKENNAIVCQYTLFFDKAMKLNMSINSPSIIIDFGWLETTLDFFKSADIKALMCMRQNSQKQQQPNKTDINIIESVMTNSIEFQLLKPTFKVILPAINKLKDDVELTLKLDYISFGEIESQSTEKQYLLKMPIFRFEWKKRLTATINNFSILIGKSISLFCDGLSIFDIVEDKKNIELIPLNQNKNPFLILKIDENKFGLTINDFIFTFDVNSYMIPELILSLLKSSIIASIISSFIDETKTTPKIKEEKPKHSKIEMNIQNADVVLIDKDIKLNSHLNSIFTIGPEIKHMFFTNFNLSFSEKEVNFAPIFQNITLEFGIKENTLIFSLDQANAYISPSDIVDTLNFVKKVINLYSNFSHQLDYSKPAEVVEQSDKPNQIKEVCIFNNQMILEFCEDNRTTEVPFPFLKLTINPNSTNCSLIKESSFLLLGLRVDIFNKKTQRWDLLLEPLELFLSFTDTKNYHFKIRDKLNLIVSHATLNQICQFRFERQSIKYKTIFPSFLVENNTPEMCELIFDDTNDTELVPPQCLSSLKKAKPFKFMGTVIDPLNFYSPQFISRKYSISIFTKEKKRYISINSPLLFKNRSNINLFYQEKHTGNVIEIYEKAITPLNRLVAEFGIYGKNPHKKPIVINLFKLKDKKKLYIPVYVEDITYYFFLSIKFSDKRGIVMFTLTPNYKIRNNYSLPIDITVDAMYQQLTIPGRSTEYLNHIGFYSSITFFIEANGHISQGTRLALNRSIFIPVYFTPNCAFSLRFDGDTITLQPPLLVQNLTGIPISIFDFQNNLILTLQDNSFEDFIGPPDFFKEGKIQLFIQIEGYEKSELFDTKTSHKELFLKSLSGDFCIPIALLFSIGATGIIYLKIDHLIYIRNESIETIHLQPIDDNSVVRPNDSLDINSGETKPVLLGTSELNYMFNIGKYKEIINLKNTLENRNKFATLFMDHNDLQKIPQTIISVDFQTSSTIAGYFVVIKDLVFPQPLVLTNLLGEKNKQFWIDIVVKCGFHSKCIVKPMSTSIISSRDLVGQKLTVFCYTQEFDVDLTKFSEPDKKTIESENIKIDIYFKLVCLENGSHMIIVSNEIENKPNRFNLLTTHEISFSVEVPFISVSLIDNRMKELSLIGFQNTSIKCQFTKDTVDIDLQIDYFQIDDMYPDTLVPVAVFNSRSPFIRLKVIKENANMIFDLIKLKLNQLIFYIDVNYVSELFNFFTTIKTNEKDEIVDVQAESIRSSIPILIKKIFIDEVKVNASASSQTGRPTFHPFPYEFILDCVPSVTNVELDRESFTKEDLHCDNKVLKKMIKDYYNPLIDDVESLIAARTFGIVFKGISNLFHKIDDSSKIDVSFNQKEGEVIQRSFQSLGKGLLNGFTGVVTKPAKGLKEDGAKGFFIGLGDGISGIVTEPVAGFIDVGTGLIDEVKNSLSEHCNPMRLTRVFNNIQIQEYDHISAICQIQYQRFVKNYDDYFVYFINGGDKLIGITETSIIFFVYNDQANNLFKKYKVNKIRQISEIENVCAMDDHLILNFNDENNFDIKCPSKEVSDIATKIIVSRSYYSNYCSNSSRMNKIASTEFSNVSESEENEIEQQTQFIINDGYYSIKCSNGKFVTNDKESWPLIANRGSAKGWEKFKITNNDDGTISFLSMKNNKYVTVGSNSKLYASSNNIARNEKFSVIKINDNHFNFISMRTRQYVSADRNILATLCANRNNAHGWERFELISRE
ncbi:hypothetical protein M9Y10_020763 [Tritrichomonas musculus]|uniref:Chorein N-terminal domain-containing protein n=2 Tax=cellular organisms TaxID=131567 RepID=A0ABR2HEI2_9EUKA